MKAHYRNNLTKGPGNGLFVVSGAGEATSLEGLTFVVKRASDQKSLGLSGWRPEESRLLPENVNLAGDEGFSLGVGPGVVNNLDPQESYRLSLQFKDGKELSGSLLVREVAYSPLEGGQGIALAKEAGGPSEPAAPAEPEQEPEAPPQEEEKLFSGPELQLEPASKPKRAFAPAAALILLLAAGLALWLYFSANKDAPGAEQAQTDPPANAEQNKDAGANAANSTAQDPSAVPADSEGQNHGAAGLGAPLARARAQLERAGDAAASLALARELLQEREGADAAFLLLEDAAQKGSPEAMLMTGRFYDPADGSPAGSIRKDPGQALQWYKKAQSAGSAEASARLEALKAWAVERAARGDARAQNLLKRF